MTTYAKVRYEVKLAPTNLIGLINIDKIIYKFHIKVTINMKSVPYDLLYLGSKFGGVELKQFSDLVCMDKLSEVFRALARGDEVSQAMQGIMQRPARTQGHAISGETR